MQLRGHAAGYFPPYNSDLLSVSKATTAHEEQTATLLCGFYGIHPIMCLPTFLQ